MSYDFDRAIERRGSDSFKWARYAGRDVLPLWVADMDFAAAPEIVAALHARVDHGVFGYAAAPATAAAAVCEALRRDYGWEVAPEWLVWQPGLVPAISACCRLLDDPADEVATYVPAYPPFLRVAGHVRRHLVRCPMPDDGVRYGLDTERLERTLPPATRLFIFCNPHNPTGRAFARAELEAFAAVCLRRNLLVCSDEIHCGLVLDADRRHIPLAALDPDLAARTITLMAPSKTFNLPGLACAFAVIPNADLRRRFVGAARDVMGEVSPLGYAACTAAYRAAGAWHAALLAYLRGNRDRVEAVVAGWPNVRMRHVEATYLAWLDMRESGLAEPQAAFLAAGVGLSDGADFGAPGFVRLNFGCPRATLDEALRRMARALPSTPALP